MEPAIESQLRRFRKILGAAGLIFVLGGISNLVFSFCMGYYYWSWVLADAVLSVLGGYCMSVATSQSYNQVNTFFKVLIFLFVVDIIIIILDSLYYTQHADELDFEVGVAAYFTIITVLVFLCCATALFSARRIENMLLVLDAARLDQIFLDESRRHPYGECKAMIGESGNTLVSSEDLEEEKKRLM